LCVQELIEISLCRVDIVVFVGLDKNGDYIYESLLPAVMIHRAGTDCRCCYYSWRDIADTLHQTESCL